MSYSLRKTSGPLSLLIVALCLWAGCGLLGLGGSVLVSPTFEATDDLKDRMEVLVDTTGTSGSSDVKAGTDLSLTAVVQVRTPAVEGRRSKASHVSYDPETGHLYAGYKLAGARFGGGIDVLTLRGESPPQELLSAERSLRSGNVDVIEVRAASDGNALFVAGAVTTEKRGASPALVLKVTPGDGSPTVRSERLSDNVAKGLVVGPAPNTVHVATDEDALYQFDEALDKPTKLQAREAAGIRSLAAHESRVFVLDRSGRVYAAETGRFKELTEVANLSEGTFGGAGIARLEADEDRLYAALNRKGFSIFAPTGEAVWRSERSGGGGKVYTCVTTGPKYLYAGRFDGAVEVYRRPTGIPDRGLEHLGTFRLFEGGYGEAQAGEPVNHLLATGGYLFVAKGREGLIVFRVDEGEAG